MNEQDRENWEKHDRILERLDERTINIYKLTQQQEAHLRQLNGDVAANTAWRKVIGAIFGTIFSVLVAALATKIKGLW